MQLGFIKIRFDNKLELYKWINSYATIIAYCENDSNW